MSENFETYGSYRIQALVSGMLIYISIGLIYAWSIFVTPLEGEFGWDRSQTSNVFTVCIIAMAFGCVAGSKLIKKHTSRLAMRIAALCMCVGLFLSSGISTLTGLYVCYGVFCGFGAGIVYNVNISTIQRWFPDKLGFVSGLLLMCYGSGSMVLGTFSSWMIATFGWRVTFRLIGIIFCGIIAIAAHWILMPSQGQYDYIVADTSSRMKSAARREIMDEKGLEVDVYGMIRRPSWWLYFANCVLITGVGLGTVSHAATISLEISSSIAVATLITGLISVCNGGGRVIFGGLYDRMPRRKVMHAIGLTVIAGALIMAGALAVKQIVILAAGGAVLGLGYGGLCTTNSFFMRKFFGDENYAGNFSLLNFSGILSALIGPSVAGMMQVHFGSYTLVMVYFAGLALAAFIAQSFIRRP